MKRSPRSAVLALVAAAAMVLAVVVPTASAVVVREPDGHFLGITPRSGVEPASTPSAGTSRVRPAGRASAVGVLSYGGGPVIHSSAPYLIFWDPNRQILGSSEALMQRYFADVAHDSGSPTSANAVARQYYDRTGFVDYRQTFSLSAQVILDTNPYPTTGNCGFVDLAYYPICLTDAQLRAELGDVISTHGLRAGLGASAPVYFIVTPANVNVCADAVDCTHNTVCAYHGYDGSSGALYASIPLFYTGRSSVQDPKACQADGNAAVQAPNGDAADVAIKSISHEDNEVLTDPLADGSGWSNGVNENGDECNAFGPFDPTSWHNPNAFTPILGGSASAGSLYNQLINGHPYYIQSEWSNGGTNCDLRPAPGSVSASFAVTSGQHPVGTAVGFDPSASTSAQSYSSATWSFGDSTPPVFRPDSRPPAAVTHVFTSAGVRTVTLTLVDAFGNLSTTSEQVTIGIPPTARFLIRPAHPAAGLPVSFTGSSPLHPNGSIRSYRWTFGDGSAPGSGVAPRHTYRAPGTYRVSLTVTDSAGLASATTRSIQVARAGVITRTSTRSTRQGVFLLVGVNGPGVVSARAKRVRLSRAGEARLEISPTPAERAALAASHRLRVRVQVRFVPVAGPVSTRTVTITFQA